MILISLVGQHECPHATGNVTIHPPLLVASIVSKCSHGFGGESESMVAISCSSMSNEDKPWTPRPSSTSRRSSWAGNSWKSTAAFGRNRLVSTCEVGHGAGEWGGSRLAPGSTQLKDAPPGRLAQPYTRTYKPLPNTARLMFSSRCTELLLRRTPKPCC